MTSFRRLSWENEDDPRRNDERRLQREWQNEFYETYTKHWWRRGEERSREVIGSWQRKSLTPRSGQTDDLKMMLKMNVWARVGKIWWFIHMDVFIVKRIILKEMRQWLLEVSDICQTEKKKNFMNSADKSGHERFYRNDPVEIENRYQFFSQIYLDSVDMDDFIISIYRSNNYIDEYDFVKKKCHDRYNLSKIISLTVMLRKKFFLAWS